ncbi:MAG TPA: sigma 54-interacting transcriptional regulator [Pyrinomonadaceae bacterium]|nr:sigma 54-interacting transcriptional regulator [Pyrinomonadaceae bacterium]
MNLATERFEQRDGSALTLDERTRLLCDAARELEAAGNYEAAGSLLSEMWPGVGARPRIDALAPEVAAEVLLRTGVLTGYLGSSGQKEGSQETAKNLITESLGLFESLGQREKQAEARVEMAVCYWREGAFDEARVLLGASLEDIGDEVSELKANALLRLTIVERSATRFNEALEILTDAAPLFGEIENQAIKGKFHNQLAAVLMNLGEAERREDYTDRALVEYSAASFHFEQAGHQHYSARVENNLGFLLASNARFPEAHEHLARARRLFSDLKDNSGVAQVDDTRARTFTLEGRYTDAERVARAAVETLEKGDEQALLAGALTTHGKVLARLGQLRQARATLERAAALATQAGDMEGAGLAMLLIIEETHAIFTLDELRAFYVKADDLLSRSQDPGALKSLRACARKIIASTRAAFKKQNEPEFIHAAESTRELLREAGLIAAGRGAVLLLGETGTGKEVLACLIHRQSGRTGRMVTINCAALNEQTFESQVFGHIRGSFTDSVEDQPGCARSAAGGTLFLDEIAELSPANQAKILRLIESGEVRSIGSSAPEMLDVRIIAATNSNLYGLVARGLFRRDLFYRLQTFHITIPPLRERTEDIRALAEHFAREARARYAKRVTFSPEAVEALCRLPLKGNARELHSLIERAVLAAPDEAVVVPETIEKMTISRIRKPGAADDWENFSLKDEIHRIERRFIELALKDAGGKVSHAARLLGYSHHESLNSLLKHRHSELLKSRKPVTPRRRSIIRKQE